MILPDIKIDGVPRKVILHEPKNGVFFVIDRTNGKFIRRRHLRCELGDRIRCQRRPIELPAARAKINTRPSADQTELKMAPDVVNPRTGSSYLRRSTYRAN